MEVTKSLRYRITVSRGMGGKFSFEATVDAEGFMMDEILPLSDAIVHELELRYPPEMPPPKRTDTGA